jgi:hypothetical protein
VCAFVALGIQHALRMHRIVICGLPHSTIFFHIFIINDKQFSKKVTEQKNVCFDYLYNLCEIFLILRINERDMITIYADLHVKLPLFLSAFNET